MVIIALAVCWVKVVGVALRSPPETESISVEEALWDAIINEELVTDDEQETPNIKSKNHLNAKKIL